MNYADRNIYGFEDRVLPECRKRHLGVVAMKVYVGIKGGFPNHRKGWVGCNTPSEKLPHALAYALDLEGVSVATMNRTERDVDVASASARSTTQGSPNMSSLDKPEAG